MTQNKAWAGAQIVGGRSYQEDAFDVVNIDQGPGPVLFLLADGMGGHAAGDVAAHLAIESFRSSIMENAKPGESCHDVFLSALDRANRAIASHTAEHPNTEGMGCTLIAVEIFGAEVRWLSVGDSLIYHVSRNGITRLNADHSMASRIDAAARRGEITWEEARKSNSRNVLLSAVTGEAISRVDKPRESVELAANDWLIIASDGIDTLSTDQIFKVVQSNGQTDDPETLCKALLAAVVNEGRERQDNTTVLVAKSTGQSSSVSRDADTKNGDSIITRPIRMEVDSRAER
ncbi:MAG: protein phosphatase 2C domain-containing protein [Ahrensia sp.]